MAQLSTCYFTDVIMPSGMNGRELSDHVTRRRPATKVLFTSGYTDKAMIHHGRLDEGVLLLSKPYRKSQLACMVRMALGDAGEARLAAASQDQPWRWNRTFRGHSSRSIFPVMLLIPPGGVNKFCVACALLLLQ